MAGHASDRRRPAEPYELRGLRQGHQRAPVRLRSSGTLTVSTMARVPLCGPMRAGSGRIGGLPASPMCRRVPIDFYAR